MSQEQKKGILVPVEIIHSKIYLIRGHKVMFDKDLAELYNVETGHLNRAVSRNIDRFPEDFMFQLTKEEMDSLRCQFGILKRGQHIKYLPFVFTEQGIAMLSSVLKSKRAVQVNIQIIRVFVRLKELILSHKDLARKIEDLERKFGDHDAKIIHLFNEIRRLMATSEPLDNYKRTKVGFVVN
ncbi:MAG: ORF6N domain-containing protein [Candidatus Omnitrophota bacterium]|nr:ORF6N domain-containing protein [Candidatus Omnitrophota bacterium]